MVKTCFFEVLTHIERTKFVPMSNTQQNVGPTCNRHERLCMRFRHAKNNDARCRLPRLGSCASCSTLIAATLEACPPRHTCARGCQFRHRRKQSSMQQLSVQCFIDFKLCGNALKWMGASARPSSLLVFDHVLLWQTCSELHSVSTADMKKQVGSDSDMFFHVLE